MSFTQSSTAIRFDTERGILMGLCEDWNKNKKFSYVETDKCLGNGNGWFKWGSDGWMGSSRNISYTANPPTIHAEMQAWDKKWYSRSVRLDEEIENHNGVLRYSSGGIGQWVEDLYNDNVPASVKEFMKEVRDSPKA